ncbi:MAG: MFS transporter [archaeon]|nr:MFS transporter [archaeon]
MPELNSNIKKFYIYRSLQSFWFVLPVFILYFQSFGITYTQLGTMELICSTSFFLLVIPVGAIADIVSRKICICIGIALTIIGLFILGIGNTFIDFCLGYFLWAVAESFIYTSQKALLYDTLKEIEREEEYLKISGRINLFGLIPLLFATFMGPFLFELNRRIPYLLMSSLWFLSLIFSLLIVEPKKEKKKTYNLKNHLIQVKKGFLYTINHKIIIWFVFFVIIMGIPMRIFNDLLIQPFFLEVGYSVTQLSITTPLIYGLATFISTQADKIEQKLGEKWTLLLIALTHSLSFIIMGLVRTPLIIIIVILLYMSRDFRWIILNSYFNKHIESETRATVLSVVEMIVELSMAITYVYIGYLVDNVGMIEMILILGLFAGICTIVLVFIKPKNEIKK